MFFDLIKANPGSSLKKNQLIYNSNKKIASTLK